MRPSLPERLTAIDHLAPHLAVLRRELERWAMSEQDKTCRLGRLEAGHWLSEWPERVRAEAGREMEREQRRAERAPDDNGHRFVTPPRR